MQMDRIQLRFAVLCCAVSAANAFISSNPFSSAKKILLRTHQVAELHSYRRLSRQFCEGPSLSEVNFRKRAIFLSNLACIAAPEAGEKPDAPIISNPLATIKKWPIFDRSYDRDIWSIALPSYSAMLLEPIANIIDMSYIGRIPDATLSLAGIGIANTILNYFGFTFFFIVVTTTTTLAQSLATAAAGAPLSAHPSTPQLHNYRYLSCTVIDLPHSHRDRSRRRVFLCPRPIGTLTAVRGIAVAVWRSALPPPPVSVCLSRCVFPSVGLFVCLFFCPSLPPSPPSLPPSRPPSLPPRPPARPLCQRPPADLSFVQGMPVLERARTPGGACCLLPSARP